MLRKNVDAMGTLLLLQREVRSVVSSGLSEVPVLAFLDSLQRDWGLR